MRKKAFLTLAIAAAAAFCSCQQQQKAYPVYFLTEASGTQEGSKFLVMHRGTPYTRMPIVNLEHVDKFRSFMSEDGSYGVELFLKTEWRNRLYMTSISNKGKKLLPVVNGIPFEPQRFDRPVTDGVLVIWGGLNGYDLKQIGRTAKPMVPEIEKKRYKDKNPRPTPQKPSGAKSQIKDANGRTIAELYD